MRSLVAVVWLAAFSSPGFSQDAAQAPEAPEMPMVQLPERDIEAAIQVGLKAKGKPLGLILRDTGRGIMNAMSKPADQMGSGFSVRIYTPISWIQQQASDAAKEYRTFALKDVAPDSLEAVLRVVVYPDEPSNMTARGRASSASVQHVVLRDEEKKVAVQPLSKEEFSEEVSNAHGARAAYVGLRARFAIADLAKVRGASGIGEFFVTVVGEGRSEKNFKVKVKHFEDLPGLQRQ